jgi:hypothetical protein
LELYEENIQMKKGSPVSIRHHISQSGSGLSYPAFTGVLLEDAYSEGWVVVEAAMETGEVVSIYSFSIERVVSGESASQTEEEPEASVIPLRRKKQKTK